MEPVIDYVLALIVSAATIYGASMFIFITLDMLGILEIVSNFIKRQISENQRSRRSEYFKSLKVLDPAPGHLDGERFREAATCMVDSLGACYAITSTGVSDDFNSCYHHFFESMFRENADIMWMGHPDEKEHRILALLFAAEMCND